MVAFPSWCSRQIIIAFGLCSFVESKIKYTFRIDQENFRNCHLLIKGSRYWNITLLLSTGYPEHRFVSHPSAVGKIRKLHRPTPRRYRGF